MSAKTWITVAALLAAAFTVPAASAHESYDLGDGEYTITVGDQNEPIYTYKWTNLDLIIRDSNGDPVADAHENLEAVLLGPGGEELDGELEGQFGEEGRYEFGEGHFYTQPGQYTLELEGTIEDVDATGSYDLPGPRRSMSDFGFPHEDVPTVLDQQATIDELQQTQQENEQLEQRIGELETQLTTLEEDVQTLEQSQEENDAPGLGVGAALAAIAAVALVAVRREP